MPEITAKKTLYIFIDESGNFDFSPNGTKFFVLTAVSSFAPLENRANLLQKVQECKYEGWKQGIKEYYFHATEDKQSVRDWVFSNIKRLKDIEIDSIVAQKNKANPALYTRTETSGRIVRSEERFYEKISQMLLKYIFDRYNGRPGLEKIVVVLGSVFTDKKRGYVLKSLKTYLRERVNVPFYIYFQATSTDVNCQIADYCGWAIFAKVERGEFRPWKEIETKVKSCFEVFKNGDSLYYQYKK